MADEAHHHAGDKPGKGTYQCTRCGFKVTLVNDEDVLPVCPRCGNKVWRKLA